MVSRNIAGMGLTALLAAVMLSGEAQAVQQDGWNMPDALKPCLEPAEKVTYAEAGAVCSRLLGSGRYGGQEAALLRFAVLYYNHATTDKAVTVDALASISRDSLPGDGYRQNYDRVMGGTCVELKRWKCASDAFRSSFEAGYLDEVNYRTFSDALVQANGQTAALKYADEWVGANPDWAGAYYLRSFVRQATGKRYEAADDLAKLAGLIEPDATAMQNEICWRGVTELHLASRVRQSCDSAVANAPDQAHIWDSHGAMNLALGNNERALADYEQALKIEVGYPHALYGKGIALGRLGRTAEGEAAKAEALDQDATMDDQYKGYGI